MACVLSYAFHAYVFIVGFAVEFKGLVMGRTELMTTSDLFLMTGQLKYNEIFAEHVGLDLWVMFEAASGTIQELFLVVDNGKAFFADRMATVEISGRLFLTVVEIIAHGALHNYFII